MTNHCDVYWGTHGCVFQHDHNGPCWCNCCDCENHPDPDSGCVAGPPYYGPRTTFYGDDVDTPNLPRVPPPREPCEHCDAQLEDDEPDPCLGMLPNVYAACCGHGNIDHAYVAISNGPALYSDKAAQYFANLPTAEAT